MIWRRASSKRLHPIKPRAQSVGFHVALVTAVARRAQLSDQPSEFVEALGVAGVLRDVRSDRGTLIEVSEFCPYVRGCERVGCRIALGTGLPLIGPRRKHVWE